MLVSKKPYVVAARVNLGPKSLHFALKTGEKFPQNLRLKSLIFIVEKYRKKLLFGFLSFDFCLSHIHNSYFYSSFFHCREGKDAAAFFFECFGIVATAFQLTEWHSDYLYQRHSVFIQCFKVASQSSCVPIPQIVLQADYSALRELVVVVFVVQS